MRLKATFAASLILGVTATAGTIVLTNNQGQLLTIDSASPGTIVSTNTISGLQNGETILGIDFRPATGQLYGLGSGNRIYTINTTTGAATFVGGAFTLTGSSFGFDFNPVPDRIRVVSDTGQNLRLNPNDGTVTTDSALNPGSPNIVAAAYTNSFPGTISTSLYVIDSTTNSLYLQNPPNNGTLSLIGSLGLDVTAVAGFDIAFPGNFAFAALQVSGGSSGLYSVNLTTGAATLIGAIGSGQTITGLSVAPTPEPATVLLTGLGVVGLGLLRRRK